MTINTQANLSKVLNIDTLKNTKYTFMYLVNNYTVVHHPPSHPTNPLTEA